MLLTTIMLVVRQEAVLIRLRMNLGLYRTIPYFNSRSHFWLSSWATVLLPVGPLETRVMPSFQVDCLPSPKPNPALPQSLGPDGSDLTVFIQMEGGHLASAISNNQEYVNYFTRNLVEIYFQIMFNWGKFPKNFLLSPDKNPVSWNQQLKWYEEN